jgi:hypothetical protein
MWAYLHWLELTRVIYFFTSWRELFSASVDGKRNNFSIRGKQIMFKAVAHAMHVYSMSAFKGVCKRMMDLVGR